MSLILDALKKLDREKSSGRSRPGNLALEILKPDLPLPQKRIPLYLAAFSITAVAAAAITYAVIAGFGFLSKSSIPATANLPQPSQQVASAFPDSSPPSKSPPPAPVKPPVSSPQITPVPPESISSSKSLPATPPIPPTPSQPMATAFPESLSPSKSVLPAPANPPVSGPQVTPASLPREPVRDAREEISRVSPKIQDPAEGKPPGLAPRENEPSQNVILEEAAVAPGITKKPVEQIPNLSATDPPLLKLSGILWHEDPLERRAVINGTVLTEGTVIEGVKVLEIHPTHVRLSHKGRPFEISMFR